MKCYNANFKALDEISYTISLIFLKELNYKIEKNIDKNH